MPLIYGKNPILEALQHEKPIEKLYIQYGLHGEKIKLILRLAREQKVPVTRVDHSKLKKIAGQVTHQGVVALISPISLWETDDLLNYLAELNRPPALVIIDRIQDTHNLGAIIRSAEILGADALIFSPRENAPLNETVVKTSAGAAMHLPICKTHSLSHMIRLLKERDIWIYGSKPDAELPIWNLDFLRGFVVIIGGEEKGIRPSLLKLCDEVFTIPQVGRTESLNASVATGVILAEALRQRRV